MKIAKYIAVALSLITALTLTSCKPTSKEAQTFNNQLMEQQKAVVIKYDELLETFDTYVPEKMDEALFALSTQIEVSKREVDKIPAIEGGQALKDEVLNYLSVYENAAATDFEHLVRLYKVPENEFTPEIRINWDAQYKDVDTRIKNAANRLREVQASFAENFNLIIK